MKVLLVNPISKIGLSFPNLGLGYIASSARKGGHGVNILDCQNKKLNYNQFICRVKSFNPDVIGFRLGIPNLSSTKKSIEMVKEWKSSVIIVIGGIHPSAVSPTSLMEDFKLANFGFRGEAEVGFPMLLKKLESPKSFELEDIPGLIYRKNDKVFANPKIFVNDLDSLDFPAWDLMDPREYNTQEAYFALKNKVTAPMITSRGCPFHCSFCSANVVCGNKVRTRSVKNVMDEIRLLYHQYGIRVINFSDNAFGINKKFTKELCNALINENLNLKWYCEGVRLESLDEDLIKLMEQAGCYHIAVGIESGSQRVLDHMNRKTSKDKIKKKIEMIKETTNIKMTAGFILGYPSETLDDIYKTINFARELPLDIPVFYPFYPLPGSPIFNELIKKRELKSSDLNFDSWNRFHKIFIPKGIPRKTFRQIYKQAYISFYLRPRNFFRFLKGIKSFGQIKFLFNEIMGAFLK